MIYIASSWKNEYLDIIHTTLNYMEFETYDFRAENISFSFDEIEEAKNYKGTDYTKIPHKARWPVSLLKDTLASDKPHAAFMRDAVALQNCKALILVLPCGNSAHIEFGWIATGYKPTIVYAPEGKLKPDLMYGFADLITDSFEEMAPFLSSKGLKNNDT